MNVLMWITITISFTVLMKKAVAQNVVLHPVYIKNTYIYEVVLSLMLLKRKSKCCVYSIELNW